MSYPYDSNQSGIIPQWDDGTLQPDGQLTLEGELQLPQYGQMPSNTVDLNLTCLPSLGHPSLHGAQGHPPFGSSSSYTAYDNHSAAHYDDWRSWASSRDTPFGGGYPGMPSQSYSLNSGNSLPQHSYTTDYSAPFPPMLHSQDPLASSSFGAPAFPQDNFPASSSLSPFDGQHANLGPSHLGQQFSHLQLNALSVQDPLLAEGMPPIPGCSYAPRGSSQIGTELNPLTLFPEQPFGTSNYDLPPASQQQEEEGSEDLGLTKDGRPRKRRPKKRLLHLSEEDKRAHEREVNSGSTARYRRKKAQEMESLEQQLQQEAERKEKLQQEYESLLLQKQQFGQGGLQPQ